ncbi:hypothetical protein FE394_03275 [Xenorhabdus sp. Reich]|uniref:Unsaturated glucuronyl hydrolase n=1 Tax=Xenorhabdus littoralis TaxID=2582835 RepID=A0ABU4SHW1_9GAMM|nr:hypothetical protein [Xenorhabdus sp. Reich]MDX7998242.1 hypothetical protein [Xenorhabdus sp. Reich]
MRFDYQRLMHKLAKSVAKIERQIAPRFPLYRLIDSPSWVTSSRGSWVAGFWAGNCWLAGYFSNHPTLISSAKSRWTQIQAEKHVQSVFRAMNAWYGFGPALRLVNDTQAGELIFQFQEKLSLTFAPWQGFPVGTEMGGGKHGNNRLSIDPCAALIELGVHHNWQEMSQAHARLTACQLIHPTGRVYTYSDFYPYPSEGSEKWQSVGEAGSWPRGQSWGMLGMACAALYNPETFLHVAELSCGVWWQCYANHSSDVLKPEPCVRSVADPSAILISAVAFFKLNEACGGDSVWQERGTVLLHQVLTHPSFIEEDEIIRFVGCRYTTSLEKHQLTEMPYGYFFLYQALLVASGTIKARVF